MPETHLGMTSFGKPGYGGPCPPRVATTPQGEAGPSSGTHRYFFKLYALDASFPPPPEQFPGEKLLENAMKSHIIDKTELIGLYKRRPA